MSDIKISVVVSAYNADKYLEQCLSSIIGQTLREIEIILVNDGSTDCTLEIMNRFASEDPRIRIIDKENGGAGSGRNAGLHVANGKYIIFLDADDFFDKEMLEKTYYRAEKDKLDMVIFYACEFDDKTKKHMRVAGANKSNFKKEIFSYKDNKEVIFQSMTFWTWNKLVLKSVIDDNGLKFQEVMSSNDALFVAVLTIVCKKITIMDEVLAYYRINNPNSLQCNKNNTWECAIDSTLKTKKILVELGIFKEIEKSYINRAISVIIGYYNCITNINEKKKMAQVLKNNYFNEIKIDQYPNDFFYELDELSVIKSIIRGDMEHCNNIIPIILVSNNHSFLLTYVTIKSIIESKNNDTGIMFYIFLNDGWNVHKKDILNLCSSNMNTNVTFIDMSSYRICGIKTNDYAIAMFDCMSNNISLVRYDKAIFIQNNVIVNCDLNKIMSIELSDHHLAAIINNAGNKTTNELTSDKTHLANVTINSDFMLLNIKRIKTENKYSNIINIIDNTCRSSDKNDSLKTIKVFPLQNNTFKEGVIKIIEKENYDDINCNPNNKNTSIATIYQKHNRPWLNRHNNDADIWWKYADDCQCSFNIPFLLMIDLCCYLRRRFKTQ